MHAQEVYVHISYIPPPGTLSADTLYYSYSRKLKWSDFKGTPRQASNSAALSFTGFSYDATTIKKRDTVIVNLSMQVYFDREGSWVRRGGQNSYALSHEQLHFDIAKLAALAFRDSLLSTNFSFEYYPIEIHMLYWDCWRNMNVMQDAFDTQTRHGMDHGAEAAWEKRINRALLSGLDQH